MSFEDSYVGISRRTERRLLLVFRRNPVNPRFAVVADLDSMAEKFAQPIAELLNRKGVDRSKELAFHLAKVALPNDSYNFLERLHFAGLLYAIPVEDVDVLDVERRIRRPLPEVFREAVEIPEEEAKRLGIRRGEGAEGEGTGDARAEKADAAAAPREATGTVAATATPPTDDLRREVEELRAGLNELRGAIGEILAALRGASGDGGEEPRP